MQHDYRDWQAHINAIQAESWDTFITLKLIDGYQVDREKAHEMLLTTWNIIDRAYFGSCGVKRGIRVQRFGVMHLGKCGKNLHYHCVAKSVGSLPLFQSLIHAVWCKGFSENASIEGCKVETVKDKRAVSVYMYHEFGKLGHMTCVDDVMHRQKAINLGTFRGLKQTRRLLRLIDKFEIEKDLY